MTQQKDSSTNGSRRSNLRRAMRRDMRRYHSRESAERSFWRSLSVLGSIGWPIALTMVGGAWLGRWLEEDVGEE